MKTLVLPFIAAATVAVILNVNVFAGPGGREPDPRIAPRELPAMHSSVTTRDSSLRGGTTIGLAITEEDEERPVKLERRFNAQGQHYFVFVREGMEVQR